MKVLFLVIYILSSAATSSAENVDVTDALKKHLGDAIEVHSDKEIWYCPDNTCEIYHAPKEHPDFPAFVYLHLYYESSYTYDSEDFRKIATEESDIRNTLLHYCENKEKDPICILRGLQKKLKASTCFGRYDEGGFWGCDEFREKALTK